MRTWDRFRAGEWFEIGNSIELIRPPVLVIGDEVAEMIRGGVQATYPVSKPPWADYVIDMEPCPWPFALDDQWATGCMVSFTDIDLSHHGAILNEFDHEIAAEFRETVRSGGHILGIEVIVNLPRGLMPIGWSAVLVDSKGEMKLTGYAYSHITTRVVTWDDPDGIPLAEMAKAGLMATSLINCSNTGFREEAPKYSRQMRRRLERKGLPLVSFKRLMVKPHSQSAHSDSQAEGEGKVAIHLVRGHFKTFTEDRPLFGKYIGTYWWQSMVRGSDQRFVIKDYEVQS